MDVSVDVPVSDASPRQQTLTETGENSNPTTLSAEPLNHDFLPGVTLENSSKTSSGKGCEISPDEEGEVVDEASCVEENSESVESTKYLEGKEAGKGPNPIPVSHPEACLEKLPKYDGLAATGMCSNSPHKYGNDGCEFAHGRSAVAKEEENGENGKIMAQQPKLLPTSDVVHSPRDDEDAASIESGEVSDQETEEREAESPDRSLPFVDARHFRSLERDAADEEGEVSGDSCDERSQTPLQDEPDTLQESELQDLYRRNPDLMTVPDRSDANKSSGFHASDKCHVPDVQMENRISFPCARGSDIDSSPVLHQRISTEQHSKHGEDDGEDGCASDSDDESKCKQVSADSEQPADTVDTKMFSPVSSSKTDAGKAPDASQSDDGELEEGENDELEEGEHVDTDHSTDGEVHTDDDCEDGEIREPADSSPDSRSGRRHDDRRSGTPPTICRFYVRGTCTWGSNCRFQHIEQGMVDRQSPFERLGPGPLPPPGSWVHDDPGSRFRPRRSRERDVNLSRPLPPPNQDETAWERGLRGAKEVRKRHHEGEPDMPPLPPVGMMPGEPPMMLPPMMDPRDMPPMHPGPLPGGREPFGPMPPFPQMQGPCFDDRGPGGGPPPMFDRDVVFFDRPPMSLPLPPPPEAWQHRPPLHEEFPPGGHWGRGPPPPDFPPRFLPPPPDLDRSSRPLSPPPPRFDSRRDGPPPPFPPRFNRGPAPDQPPPGLPGPGPLPAPPVAWSRSTDDWKDPWLRTRSPPGARKQGSHSRSASRGRQKHPSLGSFSSVSSSSHTSRTGSRSGSSSSGSSYTGSSCSRSSYTSRSPSPPGSPGAAPVVSTLGQSIQQQREARSRPEARDGSAHRSAGRHHRRPPSPGPGWVPPQKFPPPPGGPVLDPGLHPDSVRPPVPPYDPTGRGPQHPPPDLRRQLSEPVSRSLQPLPAPGAILAGADVSPFKAGRDVLGRAPPVPDIGPGRREDDGRRMVPDFPPTRPSSGAQQPPPVPPRSSLDDRLLVMTRQRSNSLTSSSSGDEENVYRHIASPISSSSSNLRSPLPDQPTPAARNQSPPVRLPDRDVSRRISSQPMRSSPPDRLDGGRRRSPPERVPQPPLPDHRSSTRDLPPRQPPPPSLPPPPSSLAPRDRSRDDRGPPPLPPPLQSRDSGRSRAAGYQQPTEGQAGGRSLAAVSSKVVVVGPSSSSSSRASASRSGPEVHRSAPPVDRSARSTATSKPTATAVASLSATSSSRKRPLPRDEMPSGRMLTPPEAKDRGRQPLPPPKGDGSSASRYGVPPSAPGSSRTSTGGSSRSAQMPPAPSSAPRPSASSNNTGAGGGSSSGGNGTKRQMTSSRREELLQQLKAVEDAIAKKRSKLQ